MLHPLIRSTAQTMLPVDAGSGSSPIPGQSAATPLDFALQTFLLDRQVKHPQLPHHQILRRPNSPFPGLVSGAGSAPAG